MGTDPSIPEFRGQTRLTPEGSVRITLIHGGRRLLNLVNVDRFFGDQFAVQKDLNDESAGALKRHVGEEADIVGIALRLDSKR